MRVWPFRYSKLIKIFRHPNIVDLGFNRTVQKYTNIANKLRLIIPLIAIFSVLLSEIAVCETKFDSESGLIIDSGYKKVNAYCIGCHTAQMITKQRKNRMEWQITLRKMQKIAGRWTLKATTEKIILDYLSKNYGS